MAQDEHGQSHDSSAGGVALAPEPASTSSSFASTTSPTLASDTSRDPFHLVANELASPKESPAEPSLASPETEPVAAKTAAAAAAAVNPIASPTVQSDTNPSVVDDTAVPAAVPQQNCDSRLPISEAASTADPEMSSQHPGPSHGLPVSYPGPSLPYPNVTGGPPAQYVPYSTATTESAESYRPSHLPVENNAMSLPSMRTLDSIPQPSGPVTTPPGVHVNSMPMPPVTGGMPFYGHHAMAVAPAYGLPSDAIARYALPHDPRLLGHRGPKKEIKRRTKTGCLTCRKRRIKCDETHPTCNNCKKSKRECLGYDPIFRQQPGNLAGSNIQPALSSQPTTPTVPSSIPVSLPSNVPSAIPPHAIAPPRVGNSYGSQPSMLPSSYAATHVSSSGPNPSAPSLSYDPALSTNPTSVKPGQGYEYSTTIDPALQTLSSTTPAHVSDGLRLPEPKALADNNSPHLRAKKMKIDEIIDMLGPAPPPPADPAGQTDEMVNEITKVYHEMYAPGLGSFFETSWYYFLENGKMSFPKEPRLTELMSSFLNTLAAVKANDHAQMAYSGILETRIVWELARICLQVPDAVNPVGSTGLPPDGNTREAKNRVRVFEALLCGEYLAENPLSPPVNDTDAHRVRQFDFWYTLAQFVCASENPDSAPSIQARESILARMRHLLDGRENRDVLYSIAVVRQLAPRFDAGYGSTIPQHLDETDPKNRLAVASKFILDESQVTGGTTNVVRRFSDIASRALVNPGVNIIRSS